ncbi:hypothetical protein CFK38_02355 [Brachybacterium vulturis]|uniref:Uncharacterized protein n=1 Tax=Brachybacterium vulturis TaxID=2017484 RepID=A0A291GIY8_9MICO|nr:hypothetical protein [Brachybacterium vulturis]ATG50493.1 hypothetical protein CFK38_02355 [Brachybacterium vulturis]
MSAQHDPSAEQPTSGTNRFPDPFAPISADSPSGSRPAGGTGQPAAGQAADRAADPARSPAPGDQDLPWKATAERRDLWGPLRTPLQGTVHSPASKAVGRPRRSPLVRFGAPVLLGGLAAVLTLVVGLGTGLAGPLLALAAAAGVGVVTLGGSGALLNAPRRHQAERPVLDASVPDSTRAVLSTILEADATTREQLAQLRPQASSTPSAASVLEDVDALVTRIDALVATEQLQSLRPSAGEVTMLEGIACRYVPDLVGAASDTIGFLQTFEGSARQEALENLESIGRQLNVLEEGVEQIEADLVGGVSRSLEVHAEFLRARFADQHLNPIIDV